MKSEMYIVNECRTIFIDMAVEGGAQSDDKGQQQASGFMAKQFVSEPAQA